MKKPKLLSALLLSLTLGMSSCVYADITTPLDTDLNQTSLGSKSGESTYFVVLGLVAWGDAGTKAAADAGGIKTITHADSKWWNVLGIVQKVTTVVYGD